MLLDENRKVQGMLQCYAATDHIFFARVPSWSVRWADLIAEQIADLNAICAICRSYIGHIWAIHKLYISHVQPTGHRWTVINMKKMGECGFAAAPHFLDIRYAPSVACTVGCTWLIYSWCVAHIWPMYDLHMAHIAFRSAISSEVRSAQRTDHQGTLAKKSVICYRITL